MIALSSVSLIVTVTLIVAVTLIVTLTLIVTVTVTVTVGFERKKEKVAQCNTIQYSATQYNIEQHNTI